MIKKAIKALALVTTGLVVGVAVERANRKNISNWTTTIKISDLDEYRQLIENLNSQLSDDPLF